MNDSWEQEWNTMEADAALKESVSALRELDRKTLRPAVICDFNGVLCEKDVSPKINELYRQKIKSVFDPLVALSDAEISSRLEQAGLQIHFSGSGRMIETLRDFVAQQCHAPRKGTPSRKNVYDFAEPAFEAGEIKVTIYPDVQPFLKRHMHQSRRVLSRGSTTLGEKIMKGVGLSDLISSYESTISFGNDKIAATFARFFVSQARAGLYSNMFLEDEFPAITGLVVASVWLSKQLQWSTPAFEVIWVDRDQEQNTFAKQIIQLQAHITQNGLKPSDVLRTVNSLEDI